MRVLLVTGLTHFGKAGVQRETERLIAGLLERDTEVGFMADRPVEGVEGLTHFHIPYPPPPDMEQRIAGVLAQYQPDVMHLSGGGARLLWAAHRAMKLTAEQRRQGHRSAEPAREIPWVVSIHNVPPQESTSPWLQGRNALHYPLRNLLRAPTAALWRFFLRRGSFTRAVCHSTAVAEAMRRAGCPQNKIVEIPLGCDAVDIVAPNVSQTPSVGTTSADAREAPEHNSTPRAASPFPPRAAAPVTVETAAVTGGPMAFEPGDSPRILSVGGLVHHKGFHDYLRVVGRLIEDYPALRYVIMGDNRDHRYRRTLERLIARLGLDERVRLIASASESQRLAAAHSADLYVVPSHEEGFCLSFLEGAMLCPRTLGTACGAIAQMSDSDATQSVVEPGNIPALEHATRRLLGVEASAAALEHRRRTLCDRFDWRRHAEAHLELYRALKP